MLQVDSGIIDCTDTKKMIEVLDKINKIFEITVDNAENVLLSYFGIKNKLEKSDGKIFDN